MLIARERLQNISSQYLVLLQLKKSSGITHDDIYDLK